MRHRDLIPKNKLISIITEMHIMDALSSDYEIHPYFPVGDSVHIYDNIFKKYKVTSAQFDTTIASYTKRPDLFLDIYNEVLIRLNYINDTINKNKPRFKMERSTFKRD